LMASSKGMTPSIPSINFGFFFLPFSTILWTTI